jgi:hypothetical protein
LGVAADVFHGEFQDVLVFDGVGDDVFVEAVAKQFKGGSFSKFIADGIFGKNGGAGEAKHLAVGEKLFDAFVGFAKLASVAFVKQKNDALLTGF